MLVNKLTTEVPRYTNTILPQTVIENGVLNLDMLTSSSAVLLGLREAYSKAIAATMIYATLTICISILPTFGMRWLNLKKISEERKLTEQTTQPYGFEKEDGQ